MFSIEQQISFTAVNCWTGECRRSFQMFTFPVIVAYTRTLALLYQGRMDTGSLYKYVFFLFQIPFSDG